LITGWAQRLHIEGTDCLLPAADYQLHDDDGTPHITRSINLPYLGGDATTRYAFAADGTTKLTLTQFIERAESMRADPSLLVTLPDDEHGQAPPCVQRLLKDGVPQGVRNEAMTQIAIYLKRVDPKDVLPRLSVINSKLLDPPLKLDEIKKISKSTSRRDYLYRCKVEPCKSLCNSAVCVTREYGIKPNEQDNNAAADALADMPPIDDIARVQDTEQGGVYRVRVNGHSFTASIKQLMTIRDAQALFVERIGVILPAKLSYNVWYDFIMERIRGARLDMQAEEDTEHGALQSQLNDFIAGRLKQHDAAMDPMQHRARLNTAPIREGEEVVFRLSTFERYCRDKRITLPQSQMRTAALLRKIGAHPKRLRTPAGVVGVWCLPYKAEGHEQHYDEISNADANHDY
jgi:hypothetical protein